MGVVAWLLYSRRCEDLQDALDLYSLVRTDIARRGRVQGVETPSQVRYLKQFEELLAKQVAYVDRLPKVPEPVPCTLRSLCFHRVFIQNPKEAGRQDQRTTVTVPVEIDHRFRQSGRLKRVPSERG